MSTTIRELTVVGQPAPTPARSEAWYRAAKRARMLSWLSLAWMGTEGLVGIATGVIAGIGPAGYEYAVRHVAALNGPAALDNHIEERHDAHH